MACRPRTTHGSDVLLELQDNLKCALLNLLFSPAALHMPCPLSSSSIKLMFQSSRLLVFILAAELTRFIALQHNSGDKSPFSRKFYNALLDKKAGSFTRFVLSVVFIFGAKICKRMIKSEFF